MIHYLRFAGGWYVNFSKFISAIIVDYQQNKEVCLAIKDDDTWIENSPRTFTTGDFHTQLLTIYDTDAVADYVQRLANDLTINPTWIYMPLGTYYH